MSFVIGVASQAQHGKDTLADRLCDRLNSEYNYQVDLVCESMLGTNPTAEDQADVPNYNLWQRAAFAANVKKVFCDTFGVDMAFVEEWKVKPEAPPGFDMPVRQALQFIGDGFRKIRGTIWLDLAFRDKTNPKIISDVRYINEFTRVKAEGGLNILIGRPDKLNDDPNGSEAQIRPYVDWALRAFHPSQKFIDLRDVDYATLAKKLDPETLPPEGMNLLDVFIRNDGTIEELQDTVDTKLVPFVHKFVFDFNA